MKKANVLNPIRYEDDLTDEQKQKELLLTRAQKGKLDLVGDKYLKPNADTIHWWSS